MTVAMLTPCTVCGGLHAHRCDPPQTCGRGVLAGQAAPVLERHASQELRGVKGEVDA